MADRAAEAQGSVFSDDFSTAGISGWDVNAGTWQLVDGKLVAGPAMGGGQPGEQQAFAGAPEHVVLPDGGYSISFDWNFLAPEDGLGVGRHGSLFFEFNTPGIRWSADTTGYQLHWIDRASDRGLNLLRWDGAGLTALQAGTFDLFPQPPANIRVEVEGAAIRVYGDDILAIDVEDETYRGGIAGLWTWDGDGNHLEFDNFAIAGADGTELFSDDFEPRPGTVDNWTIHAGTWEIADERLVAGPAMGGGQAGEQQAFAGSPPLELPTDFVASFSWEFLAPEDGLGVGRHASAFFCFNQPGIRWAEDTTGYQLHWIDRASDRGLNLLRWDGAAIVALQAGTFDLFPQPPASIRIEVEGEMIRVYGDDVLAIEVADGTYRNGIFGLWTWDGDGNHVAFDDVSITLPPPPVVDSFEDDFEREDGEVGGWTVAAGDTWAITGGQLTAGPTTTEYWIWAGERPVVTEGDAVFEFDYSFLAPGSNATVGRHGGFQFLCDEPTTRSTFSGYFIDWIDRASDRGVRLTRVDAGGFNEIVTGQGADAPADPPLHWRVEIEGETIRVFGDDVLYIDLVENTYRSGHFGFWTWSGDQQVAIDNITLGGPPAPEGGLQVPGDANQDVVLDLSDPIFVLEVLFLGRVGLPCGDSLESPGNLALLDANGDSMTDVADAIWLLSAIFGGCEGGSCPPHVLGSDCTAIVDCPDACTVE